MADINKILADTWPQWKITHELGEGGFGKVYEIVREDMAGKFCAAMKTILIPKTDSELRDALSEGMDEQSISEYYKDMVGSLLSEFTMMEKLKGNTNIVSYEDHAVIQNENGIGWTILIRMEMLKSLKDAIIENRFNEKETIKVGIDICRALEVCEKYSFIHRDIKPENIFVSELGDYKLGDFGVARTAGKTITNMSIKGTYSYMAPECYKGEKYNSSVDTYALGIVLYKLINNNRLPFLPPAPDPITYADREEAENKRMAGEELPDIPGVSQQLMNIIRHAAAYNAQDRYSSPTQMRRELEELLSVHIADEQEKTVILPNASYEEAEEHVDATTQLLSEEKSREDIYSDAISEKSEAIEVIPEKESTSKLHFKKKILFIIPLIVILLVAVVLASVFGMKNNRKTQAIAAIEEMREQDNYAEALKLLDESEYIEDVEGLRAEILSDMREDLLNLFNSGDYQKCVEISKAVIGTSGHNYLIGTQLLYLYADSLFETGDYDQAVKVYQDAVDYNSTLFEHSKEKFALSYYCIGEIKKGNELLKTFDYDCVYFASSLISLGLSKNNYNFVNSAYLLLDSKWNDDKVLSLIDSNIKDWMIYAVNENTVDISSLLIELYIFNQIIDCDDVAKKDASYTQLQKVLKQYANDIIEENDDNPYETLSALWRPLSYFNSYADGEITNDAYSGTVQEYVETIWQQSSNKTKIQLVTNVSYEQSEFDEFILISWLNEPVCLSLGELEDKISNRKYDEVKAQYLSELTVLSDFNELYIKNGVPYSEPMQEYMYINTERKQIFYGNGFMDKENGGGVMLRIHDNENVYWYDGRWANNAPNGSGLMNNYDYNSKSYNVRGEFTDGVMNGNMEIFYTGDTPYYGTVTNGKPDVIRIDSDGKYIYALKKNSQEYFYSAGEPTDFCKVLWVAKSK